VSNAQSISNSLILSEFRQTASSLGWVSRPVPSMQAVLLHWLTPQGVLPPDFVLLLHKNKTVTVQAGFLVPGSLPQNKADWSSCELFFPSVSHPEPKPLEMVAPCKWVQGSKATKDMCAQLLFSLTGAKSYSFLVSSLERALFKILFVHLFFSLVPLGLEKSGSSRIQISRRLLRKTSVCYSIL